jgi:hypothetical protein
VAYVSYDPLSSVNAEERTANVEQNACVGTRQMLVIKWLSAMRGSSPAHVIANNRSTSPASVHRRPAPHDAV